MKGEKSRRSGAITEHNAGSIIPPRRNHELVFYLSTGFPRSIRGGSPGVKGSLRSTGHLGVVSLRLSNSYTSVISPVAEFLILLHADRGTSSRTEAPGARAPSLFRCCREYATDMFLVRLGSLVSHTHP